MDSINNSPIIIYKDKSYFSHDGNSYKINFVKKPINESINIEILQITKDGQSVKRAAQALIIEQVKMKKIHSCKYLRRSHSHGVRWGHRAKKTIVEIK